MTYGMILMVNNVQCSLDFYLSLPGFSFELGTAASKEINDKFYGRREFYIQDRDGYFLGFSQLIGTHK